MSVTAVRPSDAAPLGARPWTKSYDPNVPTSLVYPRIPLTALLRETAEKHPTAVVNYC